MRTKNTLTNSRLRCPAGLTLVEMMVAMAISLLMMAAVAQLFASVSAGVSASRASITMSEALRATARRLQSDLGGVTVTMQPPRRPESGEGYFELIEGPNNDSTAYNNTSGNLTLSLANGAAINTLTGDADDVLLFTTRSKDGQPFVGKFYNPNTGNYATVESQTAEVAWFAVENGMTVPIVGVGNTMTTVPLYTLYRRMLLVAPEYNGIVKSMPGYTLKAFFNLFDLSARYDTTNGVMVLNTLGDLTKRENRFAHGYFSATTPGPPYPIIVTGSAGNYNTSGTGLQGLDPLDIYSTLPGSTTNLNRVGEDVVLTNVLAFDVRVYDPTVPLYAAGDLMTALNPADIGYWTAASNASSPVGYGDFVDLGYGYKWNWTQTNPPVWTLSGGTALNLTLSTFSGPPLTMPAGGANLAFGPYGSSNLYNFYMLYDTWSQHYEDAGPWNSYINFSETNAIASGSGHFASGSNGFDDDGNGTVDDPASPASPAINGSNGIAATPGEQQYPAPYPTPLRGIQVKIRTYEPDSKQVREVTVTQDFLPQ